MAANISASSPCDGIATAGTHAVNGYFMDVAHCHETAEHFFRPDAGQLREIAPTDTSLLHQLDAGLSWPAIDKNHGQTKTKKKLFIFSFLLIHLYPKFRPIFNNRMEVSKVDVQYKRPVFCVLRRQSHVNSTSVPLKRPNG